MLTMVRSIVTQMLRIVFPPRATLKLRKPGDFKLEDCAQVPGSMNT